MKAKSNYHVIPNFDAVSFMRVQRDKISKDIAGMDFDQLKEYFSKANKKAADKK
jgi:hypothetical protein